MKEDEKNTRPHFAKFDKIIILLRIYSIGMSQQKKSLLSVIEIHGILIDVSVECNRDTWNT